jgi:hypothetical protein
MQMASGNSGGMAREDLAALRRAVQSLEQPSFAARLTTVLGKPIELVGHALPASASQVIAATTFKAPRRRPPGGIGDDAARQTSCRIANPAQGVGHGIGRRGRHLRSRGTSIRASRFDHHYGRSCSKLRFIEHFQDGAHGHFTVRRLERIYGKDLVKAEYERLVSQGRSPTS